MTPDLEAIKARLAAATPGPWEPLLNSRGMTGVHAYECKIYHAPFEPPTIKETHDRQKADATLIAHAPTDLAALVAEVERLRGKVARMAAWLNEMAELAEDGTRFDELASSVRAAVHAV